MRIRILISLLLVALGLYLFAYHGRIISEKAGEIFMPSKPKNGLVGEKITYQVKLGRINLGKAVFRRLPDATLNERPVSLVTFETKLARFRDFEKIYSDPENFLPVKVERSVTTWPFPETITEDYDQKNFVLTINKTARGRSTQKVFKKNGPINNALLLPYYVRNATDLDKSFSLKVLLPIQEFTIQLAEKTEVEVPAGKFMAYRFKSTPDKFEIWISADERRIPLKIRGSSGLGYVLVMEQYSRD